MAVLVWKCLHDVVPGYLAVLCVLTAASAGRRRSCLVVSGALMVPSTRTLTGQCSFAVYGPTPRTWNQLPSALRLPDLPLSSFKCQLKIDPSLPALVWWLHLWFIYHHPALLWLLWVRCQQQCPDSTQLMPRIVRLFDRKGDSMFFCFYVFYSGLFAITSPRCAKNHSD